MKSSILIVHHRQYGHHTGSLQYCRHLKNDFNITFICWDYGKKIITEPGVRVIYITRSGNKFSRKFRFIQNIINHIRQKKFDLVFIHYFQGCSLIPIFCRKKPNLHLDIRTGSISLKRIKRIIYNSILLLESQFFKKISIISEGLRDQLDIKKDAYILPLGANPVNVNKKVKHKLHLLYIGTLTNRKLEDTIYGTYIFLNEFPSADIHYTIVGDGYFNEIDKFKRLIHNLGIQSYIDLTGYVPSTELNQFYEIANVGVSYVPKTTYFKFQPVTKTYEYLMAGMPVIATGTFENMKIINNRNGFIIEDNPKSFANSLKSILLKINDFDDHFIRESVAEYNWESIIARLKEYIFSIS